MACVTPTPSPLCGTKNGIAKEQVKGGQTPLVGDQAGEFEYQVEGERCNPGSSNKIVKDWGSFSVFKKKGLSDDNGTTLRRNRNAPSLPVDTSNRFTYSAHKIMVPQSFCPIKSPINSFFIRLKHFGLKC